MPIEVVLSQELALSLQMQRAEKQAKFGAKAWYERRGAFTS